MEDLGLGTVVSDSAFEFLAVTNENIEDISEENNLRIVIEVSDEVNAIYIKTENKLNTSNESPVQEEIKNLREEAVTNGSDILMREEEDPLLLTVPCASKKGSDGETCKKLDPKGKCEICGKKFPDRSKLSIHMRVHTGEKPYSCEVCNKAFSQKYYILENVRILTKEKPYTCEICSKSFCGRSNLVKHIRLHTKKPFSCDICNKAFSDKEALGEHVRVHTTEKPFGCDICKKAFSVKGALERHMRVHTKEKPFKCQRCSKSFSEKGYLTKHIRVHTQKPDECRIGIPSLARR